MALKTSSSARNPQRRTTREGSGKKGLPLILMAVGILLVIVLAFLFSRRGGNQLDQEQLRSLEARLLQIERKTAQIKLLDGRVTKLDKEFQDYTAKMKGRVDGIEKSVALIQKQISTISRSGAGEKTEKGPAAKMSPKPPQAPKAGAKERFHTVRSGESLFRIGRHYGLTVNELLRLNHLKPGAIIYPGQKLRIPRGK